MTKATLLLGQHLFGDGLQCQGSVHYHNGRKHASVQANRVLEEVIVMHLDPTAAKRGLHPRQPEGESQSLPYLI